MPAPAPLAATWAAPAAPTPASQTTAEWTSFKGLRRHALGNAFDHGNIIAFARGGIVGRPTIFPMARGMGLMGEAGPEAVVPLKRMPSGNLGVEGGGGVTVNIINHTPSQVSTEGQRDERGGMTLNVVIDSIETSMAQRLQRPGSQLNRAMATAANPIKAR